MARIKQVKANKEYDCQKCSAKINKGDKYYNVRMKRRIGGVTWHRCLKCRPLPSETTSSDTLSSAYRIQEGLQATANAEPFDWKGAADDIENAMSDLEELDGELDEKISNLESAFQGGCPALDTLQEYKENVDRWRDEMESNKSEIESITEDVSEGAEPTQEQVEEIKGYIENSSEAGEF